MKQDNMDAGHNLNKKKRLLFLQNKARMFFWIFSTIPQGCCSCCTHGKRSIKSSISCYEKSHKSRDTEHFQIIHGKLANVVLKSNSSVKTSLPHFSFCYGYMKNYGINPFPFGSCLFDIFMPSYKNVAALEILNHTQNKGINTLRIPGTYHH